MLTRPTSLCIIMAVLLILTGIWLAQQQTRVGMQEGMSQEQSENLVEHTQTQREEAVHAAGKYDSDRGTARSHAKLMTELLHTLDAELVSEMIGYAEARHKEGNSYALMNKHAAHASAINTLRTSCEDALKAVQAA